MTLVLVLIREKLCLDDFVQFLTFKINLCFYLTTQSIFVYVKEIIFQLLYKSLYLIRFLQENLFQIISIESKYPSI